MPKLIFNAHFRLIANSLICSKRLEIPGQAVHTSFAQSSTVSATGLASTFLHLHY
jgi:hypothetical protein